jgi:hypothetical protein
MSDIGKKTRIRDHGHPPDSDPDNGAVEIAHSNNIVMLCHASNLGGIAANKDNTSLYAPRLDNPKYLLFCSLPEIFVKVDHGRKVSSDEIGQGGRLSFKVQRRTIYSG